jgi:hypothetical protein
MALKSKTPLCQLGYSSYTVNSPIGSKLEIIIACPLERRRVQIHKPTFK